MEDVGAYFVQVCDFLFFLSWSRIVMRCLFRQDDNFSLFLLNELCFKYGLQTHLSHSPLPQKLEELREFLRKEIKKELKIKEGAENLKKVAKDRKSVSDVNSIVKKANSKLTDLQQELHELESQILVSQRHTPSSTPSGMCIVVRVKVLAPIHSPPSQWL